MPSILQEFWNTVSNISMIIPPLYGLYNCKKMGLEARYVCSYLLFLLVGIGSTMFHATLLYPMQLLDELPMVYTTCVFIYSLAVVKKGPGTQDKLAASLLTLYAIAFTLIYSVNSDPLIMEGMYGFLVCVLLVQAVILLYQDEYNENTRISWRLGLTGVGLYLVAFILWNIDNHYCSNLKFQKNAESFQMKSAEYTFPMARRVSLIQQYLSMDPAEYLIPGLARLANAQDAGAPRKEGEATIESLPVDCLGLILDMTHQYWRKVLKRLLATHPYLKDKFYTTLNLSHEDLDSEDLKLCKKLYKNLAQNLNQHWKQKSDLFEPAVCRNGKFFCQHEPTQKIVNLKVTGDYIVTVLGPRTRADPNIFAIKVYDRATELCVNELVNLTDKPEYLVFSSKYNLLVTKAHESCRTLPDRINIWSLLSPERPGPAGSSVQPQDVVDHPPLRNFVLRSSGVAARCTSLVLKEDFYFGSSHKEVVVMAPTRSGKNIISTNSGIINEGSGVAIEEVGRVMVPHLVQLGTADFSDKWAVLFSEAPKELPDRQIQIIVIDMSTMSVKHMLKAYEPRIAVYGASLHPQDPDIAVTVGKDGYLKVFDLNLGRELTKQRVPKPMARTNCHIMDFYGTTRFLLGSITDIHVFSLQFPLYPSQEARMDRIERRREHIRTVSIHKDIYSMVEERNRQLAPPPGIPDLDPLLQLQHNLAALNQVNQAIEANIVGPHLPEEVDRVEQFLVEFRAVQQRIHDLNQEMEARISVAIEAVAADLRHIFVLTNTGDVITFDIWDSVSKNPPAGLTS